MRVDIVKRTFDRILDSLAELEEAEISGKTTKTQEKAIRTLMVWHVKHFCARREKNAQNS